MQNLVQNFNFHDLGPSLRTDLDLQYSHTFISSISCLQLPAYRSQAAIVSEKSTVFTFSYRKAKFYVKPPWEGGIKVYINGPEHMTKMAAMPTYSKNLQKSSPEPEVL